MAEQGRVEIKAEWAAGEHALVVRYAIRNGLPGQIVVFDRLYATDVTGVRTVEPGRAFVVVTGEGLLVMDKLIPALPEDREVETPLMPYGRLVEPGQVLTGEAAVQVPVLTWPAYGKPGQGAGATRAKQGLLRIGYAPVGPEVPARPYAAPDGPAWALPHAWAAGAQRVIEAPRVELDLPVAAMVNAP